MFFLLQQHVDINRLQHVAEAIHIKEIVYLFIKVFH